MGGQVNLGKISKRTVCFQQNLALDSAIAPIFKALIKNFGALHRCTVRNSVALELARLDATHGFPHLKDKTIAIIFVKSFYGEALFYCRVCRSVSSVPGGSG